MSFEGVVEWMATNEDRLPAQSGSVRVVARALERHDALINDKPTRASPPSTSVCYCSSP